MRKLFAALLLVAVILATAACGTADQNAQQATTAPTSQADATEPQTTTVPPTTEPPHEHSYAESKVAPTCTTDGYTLYSCSCGDSYKDNHVPATGHSYTESVVSATCVKDGYTTHTCACGHSYIDTKVAAPGHKFGDWKTIKKPTETDTGLDERECSVCHTTETRISGKLEEGHTHDYKEKVTKAATCSAEGVKTFTCSCGDQFTESIAKTPHKYVETVTKPTCINGGYTTHKCSVCGDTYTDKQTPALGHSWVEATCTAPKTCTTCKATTGTELGHTWNNATCTEAKNCTTCGTTSGNELGHSWKAATCTSAKTCSRCSKTDGSELGHDYTTATCQNPATCKRCSVTKGTTANHSWVAASCTAPKTCSECKKTEGSVLGHNYKSEVIAATCTTDGKTIYTCSRTGCGHSYEGDVVKKLGHKLPATPTKVVAPTCEEKGYDLYQCANCTYSEKKNYVAANGQHNYEVISNTATCTSSGVKTEKCSMCGDTKTTDVGKGQHNYKTVRLSEAAKLCYDKWGLGSGASKYLNYTDWNVDMCDGCYLFKEDTIRFAYSDYEAAVIMLGYVNDLRESVYGTDKYNLTLDSNLVRLANERAEEISIPGNFHHGGAPCPENITNGGVGIYAQFTRWKNSTGHYEAMINKDYKVFGYGIYRSDTGAIYGSQLFNYF